MHEQCAARSDPELKSVQYGNVAVLTAELSFDDSQGLDLVVVLSGLDKLVTFTIDLVSTGIRIVDGDQSALGDVVCIERESLLLRRCASVLNRVVSAKLKECREPLFFSLACVGTVPAGIHIGVQAIVEAGLVIDDVDWLGGSVQSISILRLKEENT